MKEKHTPGPWDDIDLMDLISGPNETIEANLALMNEAPEMKRMLLMAMSIIIKYGHTEMIEEYNALIQKLP